MKSFDLDDELSQVNAELRQAGISLQMVVRGKKKISLRGTLPSKSGGNPSQQFIPLGLDATPYGIRQAKAKAFKIYGQLSDGSFRWDDWVDTRQYQSCAYWIDRYRSHWMSTRGNTAETEAKWQRDIWMLGLRWLPPEAPLCDRTLKDACEGKPANSRIRQRMVQILTGFAKFAGVEVDLSDYRGSYSPGVKELYIPTEQEIEAAYQKISNPEWRLFFARMAIYGMRNHECWFCQIEDFSPYNCNILKGKYQPRYGVKPRSLKWAEEWKPWEGTMPKVNFNGDYRIYGERSARAFKRMDIEFTPYSLRHACCIYWSNTARLPLSTAAAYAGHSPEVHLKHYHRWISQTQHDEAYIRAMTQLSAED